MKKVLKKLWKIFKRPILKLLKKLIKKLLKRKKEMKDLKIYYKTNSDTNRTNSKFEADIEKLAKEYGLVFSGSGLETETRIRELHYIKK